MISLRRIASSSALRALDVGVQVISALWITPQIVRALGQERYGLWVTVLTLVTYIDIFDLGLTNAVTRYVSRALGQQNPAEACEVIRSAFTILLQIGLGCLVLVLALAAVAPVLLRDSAQLGPIQLMIVILGFVGALSFPMRVFAGVLEAHVRYELTTSASIVRTVLTSIALWWVANHGGNLVQIVVIVATAGLLQRALNFVAARRVFPQMRLLPLGTTSNTRRLLLDYGGKNFLLKLVDVVRFRIDNLVIARCVGIGAVGLYAPGVSLIRYFREAIECLGAVFMPIFSSTESTGNREQLRIQLSSAIKATAALSTFVGGTLMLYGGYFIDRWLGPAFHDSYRVMLVMAPSFIFGLAQNPGIHLLYGLSKQEKLLRLHVFEAGANLLLSVWLVWRWGIFGVAAGTAISLFVSKAVLQPMILCAEVGLSRTRYYFDSLLFPMLKTATPMLLCYFLLQSWLRPDYGRLLIAVVAQTMALLPVAWWLFKTERPILRLAFSRRATS
jgi:O-antigen/teichoic acid export membrane protein